MEGWSALYSGSGRRWRSASSVLLPLSPPRRSVLPLIPRRLAGRLRRRQYGLVYAALSPSSAFSAQDRSRTSPFASKRRKLARRSTLTLGGKLDRIIVQTAATTEPSVPSHEDSVREQRQALLRAYHEDILSKVDRLPFIIRAGKRSNGPVGRYWPWRVRWRWLLRYFIVDHIRRSLAATKRHYHAQAAIALDPAIQDEDLSVIENYEKSLPSVGVKHFLLLSVIAVLGLTYLVTRALASVLDPAPRGAISSFVRNIVNSSVARFIPMLQACKNLAPKLRESWVGIVSELDAKKGFSSLADAAFADWSTFLTFLSFALLSIYLLALIPASAYRLKRLLLSRRGDLPAPCTCSTRSRATGLYSDERAFFDSLGIAQPKEIPSISSCPCWPLPSGCSPSA